MVTVYVIAVSVVGANDVRMGNLKSSVVSVVVGTSFVHMERGSFL